MSPMRLIILAVAGAAAVMAALLVRGMVGGTTGPTDTPETIEKIVEVEMSQTKVLVMRADVRVGHLLTPDDFQWSDWPERSVNIDYYVEADAPDAIETLTGSVVRTAMYADEPVLPQKLVQKGETGFMAALLKPGMRALSVEISPESASAGFILPDDRVDVILTQEIELPASKGRKEERTVSTTILENVRILAIDQTFGDVEGIPTMTGSTATMELLPEQAELVALASRTGAISLTLRSYADADFNEGNAKSTIDLSGNLDAGGNQVVVYRAGVGGSK